MAKDLTERQEEFFNYIKKRIDDSGIPPTIREIGEQFGITVKGAYDHLKAIEKKGYIRCEQNKSRSIELLVGREEKKGTDSISIPLLGEIAAGSPIYAEENITEYLDFPISLLPRGGEFFALSIRGDSMEGAGIFDRDIAIIQKQSSARNGDIVAALIENEATLKRFKKEKDSIHLIAENPRYSPIITKEVSVLGVIAGIYRKY